MAGAYPSQYRSSNEISCCTKYFLFSFNVLFWLLGLLLLTCGIWAWTEKGFFDDIADQTEIPLDPVVLIISIGLVMFILSFAGCLGSLRENICLLKFVSLFKIYFPKLTNQVFHHSRHYFLCRAGCWHPRLCLQGLVRDEIRRVYEHHHCQVPRRSRPAELN